MANLHNIRRRRPRRPQILLAIVPVAILRNRCRRRIADLFDHRLIVGTVLSDSRTGMVIHTLINIRQIVRAVLRDGRRAEGGVIAVSPLGLIHNRRI